MAGFASWLFGLPAQQPGEYRRLMRIRQRIYTTVAPLKAEIVRSPEPIPFAELDRSAFRRCGPGRAGARSSTAPGCASRARCPPASRTPVVMLGIRGEGLVYSADGRGARLGEHGVPAGRPAAQRRQVPPGAQRRPVDRRASSSTPTSPTTAGSSTRSAAPSTTAPTSPPATTRPTRSTTTTSRCSCSPGRPRMPRSRRELRAAPAGRLRRASRRRHRRRPRRARRPARAARRRATSSTARSATATSTWPGSGRCARPGARPPAPTCARSTRSTTRDDYIYGTSQPQQMSWMKQRHPALFERMQAGRRRRTHRDCRARSGSSPTPTCRRASRSCARRSSAGASCRRSSGSPTSSCGCAGCPTRSATTATCRRSCAERHGLVPDHQARVEQGQRLPAPHLPLGGHRRLERARAHAARGRLQQPRRGRRPAHRARRSTPSAR